MLGFLITSVLMLFLLIGIIASIASFSSKDTVVVSSNSILHIQLTDEVVDRGGGNPFDSFDFMSMSLGSSVGLNDLLKNLEKAKHDKNIEGIFLDMSYVGAGWASLHEIRQALLDFKESGKFIVSYGETYMQSAYYLGSVADEVYLHPEGLIDFRGINSELIFLKNTLDRLGIDPQLIRHGEFKSAGEPLIRENMSAENREQVRAYIGSIWNNVLSDIAKSRNVSINHLNEVADGLFTRNPQLALEYQMIDGILHHDQFRDVLKAKAGLDSEDDLKLVSLSKYHNAPNPPDMEIPKTRDRIAVIYASGNIMPGEGSERIIGSDRIAKAIREARENESVKAIVLRINSPGGSALASDVILHEVKLAAEEKPVVASMGDLAASGGYYIACAADHIVASPTTLTGSIGVFGMIPNMQGFFNDKLGVTFDNVKTNQFADMASISRPLTRAERDIIQEEIGRVYDTFIGHVAEGRNIPVAMVDELGRGRVWSGAEARQNGLIDEYGGLQKAIEIAAEMAELETYRIREYPERKDFVTRLLEDFGGIQERMIQKRLGTSYKYYQQLNDVREMTGILTRLPYDISIE